MSDSIPVWAAIILPLLGFLAAILTEFLRGWQTLRRDREARKEDRHWELENERRSFERETLLALQDSISTLMRNAGAIFHANEMEFCQHATWGRRQLPNKIGGDEASSQIREFQKLRVRILDSNLRRLAGEWSILRNRALLGALQEEPDDQARRRSMEDFERCGSLFEDLNEEIGRHLRKLISRWDS